MNSRAVGVVGWACVVGCALVIALWVRSRSHTDAIALFAYRGAVQVVASDGGRIATIWTNVRMGSGRTGEFLYLHFSPEVWGWQGWTDVDEAHEWAGFGWGTGTALEEMPEPRRFVALVVPHWFVVLLLVVPGARAVARARRERRRLRRGLCVRCGYDLRASRERCPECGTETDGAGGAVARAST